MNLVERAINLVDGHESTMTEAAVVETNPSKVSPSDLDVQPIKGPRSGVESIQGWVDDAQRTLRDATTSLPRETPPRVENELSSMQRALELAETSLDDASSNVRSESYSAAWDDLDDAYRRLDEAVDSYEQAMGRFEDEMGNLDKVKAARLAYAVLISTLTAQRETEELMAHITDNFM